MQLDIIYEDENLVAVNKPAGLLTHGDRKTGEDTLVNLLLVEFPEIAGVGDSPLARLERPGIVHRLDKDTSGVVLVARNQEFFEYLKDLFQNRRIKKTYRAVVLGHPKEARGRIDAPIGLKTGSVKRIPHRGKELKPALTEYRVLREFEGFSYVEIYPHTGRTHQIRVHLNLIGHPVAGDRVYGGKTAARTAKRQMLHAYSLEFHTKTKGGMVIVADPPQDFADFLRSLEK